MSEETVENTEVAENGGETGGPDIEALVNQLVDQRLSVEQPDPEPAPVGDFGAYIREPQYDEYDGTPGLSDADIQAMEEAGLFAEEEPAEEQVSPELEALYERLEQHEQVLAQQSEEQARAKLNALVDKYPDIMSPEILPTLRERVEELAERFGENVASDPAMVEMLYRNIKFDVVKSGETPAEVAAARGTSLESGGAVSEQPEPDFKDEYIKALRGAGDGSVFV